MIDRIDGRAATVFIGHRELWPTLDRCPAWQLVKPPPHGLRRLRILDAAGVVWVLIQYELGSTLTMQWILPALTGVNNLEGRCLYYHKWTSESGGCDQAFTRE